MRRVSGYRAIGGVLVAAALASLGAGPGEMPELTRPDPGDLRAAVVHRVIDGDSVELFVDGRVERYELAGADAPDVVHPDRAPIPGAQRARGVLELMISGERLLLLDDPVRATDALGRRRGFVFRSPEMTLVNLEMVRLGLARHAHTERAWNARVFRWAQSQARASGKGVWDPAFLAAAHAPAARGDRPAPAPDAVGAAGAKATTGAETDGADEPEPEADPGPEPVAGGSDAVYVTRSGTKYHRAGCPHLTDSATKRERSEVASTHEPCKVCDPDED